MVGTIVTYILGAILHWRTIIYVSCVYPLGALLVAMVVPESPSWLVAKGNAAEYRRCYGDVNITCWSISVHLFLFFIDIYSLDRIEDARKAVSWFYGDKNDNWLVIDREINILKDTLVQRKSR